MNTYMLSQKFRLLVTRLRLIVPAALGVIAAILIFNFGFVMLMNWERVVSLQTFDLIESLINHPDWSTAEDTTKDQITGVITFAFALLFTKAN